MTNYIKTKFYDCISDVTSHKLHYIFLLIIIAIGFSLRSVELFSKNYIFGFDHGRDYLLVKEMIDYHKLRLIGAEVGAGSAGLSGIFHGPGHLYLLSIFYISFKGDPYGSIVYMFIFGFGTLLITYIVSRKIFSRNNSLLVTFLIAVAPEIVTQSRFLWNPHPSSFFIIIVLYLVYKIPKSPRKYLPLALFTAGFIYHFQLAIAVPLVFTIIIYSLFFSYFTNRKTILFSSLAVIGAFIPAIIFEFRHEYQAVNGLIKYFNSHNTTSIITYERFLSHIKDYYYNIQNTFIKTSFFFFRTPFFFSFSART